MLEVSESGRERTAWPKTGGRNEQYSTGKAIQDVRQWLRQANVFDLIGE